MNRSLMAFATLLSLGTAPAFAQSSPPGTPSDSGSMAYPTPLPQGQGPTTSTTGQGRPTDTGNMAYPAPLPQGNATTTPRAAGGDTGSMAYPTPLPQGNVGTTTAPK